MKISWKYTLNLFKETLKEFNSDDVFAKAAAVSYYAVFALPGLMLISITVATIIFDEQRVIDEFTEEFADVLGESGAQTFQRLMTGVQQIEGSWIATTIGVLTLVFGSTAIFIQLQKSLNSIWDVTKKPDEGVKSMVRDRLISLALVLILNILFLLFLTLSTMMSAFNSWISTNMGAAVTFFSFLLNIGLSIAILAVVFALVFKYLPDVEISWRVVWPGALITAVLFTIGKELIAFYLTHSDVGSTYGAGSAIILFLLWIYYSSLIVFFGAEFTQVYARKEGERLRPAENAQQVSG